MPVFAIVSATEPAKLAEAIRTKFQDNFIELPRESGWLVAAHGSTAQQVSDTLGISEAQVGSAMVFTIAGYWGRAPKNLWEWLAVKLSQT